MKHTPMKRATAILTALAILTVCSCGCGAYVPVASLNGTDYSVSRSLPIQSGSATPDVAETIDRKIIKRGDIEFETTDVNKTKSSIVQTVRELNGYISQDNVVNRSSRIEHRLTVRVPANNFDLLLENISEGVDKFDSKNISVLDVTAEYIDVQSRIKTKRALQARYTELLTQATTVDEMLTIEREIGKLQTEIESVEGRMRYLTDRIAFSTLNVTYYQRVEVDETDKFSFASELKDGIKTGWEIFLWFIIGLSYLWVFILLGIAGTYFIYLLARGKKK